MLIDLIRKVIPIKERQNIGLWTAEQAGRFRFLCYPYFYLLCGTIPKNLRLLSHKECAVTYLDKEVVSPRDGILAFIEVFQDEVYEKARSPRRDDIVIDAGAYVGAFTVKASGLVGKGGTVVAIEPAPENIAYLKRNVESLENVVVVESALSDYSGTGQLHLSSASPCHTLVYQHKESVNVRVDTLDNIVDRLRLPKVDFLKVDIEGIELQALEGAKEILKGDMKLAIASYHTLADGSPELPAVANLLESAGYKLQILDGYIYAEREK